MRIAVVGKWGSGKSTVTSVLIKTLHEYNKLVSVIDADINQHMIWLLTKEKLRLPLLSDKSNMNIIREYLLWTRSDVELHQFVKSTPPSSKSNLWSIDKSSFLINKFWFEVKNNIFVMNIWSYDSEWIAKSCYHNNLAIAENILSHHKDDKDEYLICDMVAWTDAFAWSMYAQFDLVLFVIEATEESMEVYNQFLRLAKTANINNRVEVIANKVIDDDDITYIKSRIEWKDLLWYIWYNHEWLKDRRRWETIFTSNALDVNKSIDFPSMQNYKLSNKERIEAIIKAHEQYCSQAYVKKRIWDWLVQIEKWFSY